MIRDGKYREFVRSHSCCSCFGVADVAHHFGKRYAGGGIGVKPHDTFEVPLCAHCHAQVHQSARLGVMSPDDTERLMLRTALVILTEYLQIGSQRMDAKIPNRRSRK